MSGVVTNEVRTALYATPVSNKPPVLGFIGGLGGREVTVPDVEHMYDALYQQVSGKQQPMTQWVGLRE